MPNCSFQRAYAARYGRFRTVASPRPGQRSVRRGSAATPSDLAGRPYALPVDILGELHGPLFYADYSGFRKLYACSLELVEELCDESRFAKNLTASLARVRPLAGDGLFTAYPR